MTTQKAKTERKSAGYLKNFRILSENSAEGLRSRRELCQGYQSIYENIPKKLLHLPLKVATTLLSGSRKGPVGA